MMSSWYNNLAVCMIMNSMTIVLGLSCNSTQKLRLDKGGDPICCFTTKCDLGEQFQLCNSHDASDTCLQCPLGYTTGIVIDTELVESHFNPCILPLCKGGTTLTNGSCVCDTDNGYFGNDSDSCVFKQCDFGYKLTYQGKCVKCVNGQYNCTANTTRGIADSNKDQSTIEIKPLTLVLIVFASLAIGLVILIAFFVYRRFRKKKRMRHFDTDISDYTYAYADDIRITRKTGNSSPETELQEILFKVNTSNVGENHYNRVSRFERERPRQASPLPIRIHVPETEQIYLDVEASTFSSLIDDSSSEPEQVDVLYTSSNTTNENNIRPNEDSDDSVYSTYSIASPERAIEERENDQASQSELQIWHDNQSGPCYGSQANGNNDSTNLRYETSFNLNTPPIRPSQIPYSDFRSLVAVALGNDELDVIQSDDSCDRNVNVPLLKVPEREMTKSNQQVRTDMMDEPFRNDELNKRETPEPSDINAKLPQCGFPERNIIHSNQQETEMKYEPLRNNEPEEIEPPESSEINPRLPKLNFPERNLTNSNQQVTEMKYEPFGSVEHDAREPTGPTEVKAWLPQLKTTERNLTNFNQQETEMQHEPFCNVEHDERKPTGPTEVKAWLPQLSTTERNLTNSNQQEKETEYELFCNDEHDEKQPSEPSDINTRLPQTSFPERNLSNCNQQTTKMKYEPFRNDELGEREPPDQSDINARLPQLSFNERILSHCNHQEIEMIHEPQTESNRIIRMFGQLKEKRKDRRKACQELRKEIDKIQQQIDAVESMLTDMLSSGSQEEPNDKDSVRREFKDEDNIGLTTMEDLRAKLAGEKAEYLRLQTELREKKQLHSQVTMVMEEMLRSYDTDEEGRYLDYGQHGACGIHLNDANSKEKGAKSKVYYAARKF